MVQTHTIDVGIDLGTTNSAVAVMHGGKAVVVPNVRNHQITPSVVRIRANGGVDVGDIAYQRLGLDPGDVHGEFKRAMGDHLATYAFRSSGRKLRPAELSAEVLKTLLADVQRVHGLNARAAVVTVPAAFDLAQCAATQEAARLAGLEQAPLLQEPIAASLAYGYSQDLSAGRWLVFDLGGGTFDLALVGIRDGQIAVLDHEGDNFLGGKDFDWLVVERVLLPRLGQQFDVRSFQRGNDARQTDMALLKLKAEEVKIALTAMPQYTATVESGKETLRDDRGAEIYSDILVTRDDLERAIDERLEQAVALSRRVLDRNPGQVDSVLLVGGPTLMPCLRVRVRDRLGLEPNTSVNPMTAVAEGAAIFAATQPLALAISAGAAAVATAPGALAVEVKHPAVTEDSETTVGVRIPEGMASTVEIAAADGSWRSGALPLRSGAAISRVPLRARGANEFTLAFADELGRMVPASPDQFAVHRGLTAAAPPLSRSIGLVVRELGSGRKMVDWLLRKDTPLPARAKGEFRTTLALEPGGEIEIVGVYLVEGESERADRNRIVGRIDITDRQVPRTVPAGSPVEVRVEVSASRLLKAQVFIPSIDHTFDVEVQVESEQPTVKDLTKAVLGEQQRIDESAPMLTGDDVMRLNHQAQDVTRALHAVGEQDPGARQQAVDALHKLQSEVDRLDEQAALPRAIKEAEETLEDATRTLSSYGSESQQTRLRTLALELEQAMVARDLAQIERAESRVGRLRFEVLAAQPWFWKEYFEYLSGRAHAWRDPAQADQLVREGTNAIIRGDVSALKRCVIGLVELAPGEEGSLANVGLRRS